MERLQELSLRDSSFSYEAFEAVCEVVGGGKILPGWKLLDLRGAEERFVTKEAVDGWVEARVRMKKGLLEERQRKKRKDEGLEVKVDYMW